MNIRSVPVPHTYSLYTDGHGTFYVIINSFVHVVMYTYYLVAALGPEFKKYLWWKKYVTVLQIVSLMIKIAHLYR